MIEIDAARRWANELLEEARNPQLTERQRGDWRWCYEHQILAIDQMLREYREQEGL